MHISIFFLFHFALLSSRLKLYGSDRNNPNADVISIDASRLSP